MNPLQAYRKASRNAWSRIDMLLAIYAAALDAARDGARLAQEGNSSELIHKRLRLQKMTLLLLDGIAPEMGDVPRQIQQLCLFILDQITSDDPAAWESAVNILSQLHDAFAQIREEAVQLEAQGTIPPLDAELHVGTLARS
ncbi:MAG: hypothetical protein ACF8TS_10570 [Maioricimonas sp. JB049]